MAELRGAVWAAGLSIAGALGVGCSSNDAPLDAGRADGGARDAVDDLAPGDGPVTPACAAAATCGACAATDGCGWCIATARCLAGTTSGSSDGTCSGAGWDFTGDLCNPASGDGGTPPLDGARGCVPTVARGGEATNALCSNGVDDDCNGYTDCADFRCSRNAAVTVCADAGGPPVDAGPPRDAGPTGPIGPTGGAVDLLHFGVFGDVRPPVDNDTTGYPSAIVGGIMSDFHDLAAQFAIATGDYMFATTASTVDAQVTLFLSAEAMYGGYVFHGFGNHECTGGTASNCPAATETANARTYMSRLNAGHSAPYFDWVVRTSLGDAHFIATAPNAWSTAQQSWLATALAQRATYTFVLAHEPPSGTQGPGSAMIDSMVLARPGGVTLRLYGHTHEYRRLATNAVIDGNAGAPLQGTGGTGDYYGFAMIDQRADGDVVFTAYELGRPPMVHESFVVHPDGTASR